MYKLTKCGSYVIFVRLIVQVATELGSLKNL